MAKKTHSNQVQLLGTFIASFVFFVLYMPLALGAGASVDLKPFLGTQNNSLRLLQPLDDSTTNLTINNNSQPLDGFYEYFNLSWPLVVGSAAGIAVLYGLIGAIQIMLSGGGNGQQEGKARIQNAIIALLVIGLSGMILEIINPIAFNQV